MFAEVGTYPVVALGVAGVTDEILQDLNGDGLSDVVLATYVVGDAGAAVESQVWVYLTTDGGFSGPTVYSAPPPGSRGGPFIVLADLNGDGRADLVLSTGTSLDIRLDVGDGAFGEDLPTEVACGGGNIVAIDANADGWRDIVQMVGCGTQDGDLLLFKNDTLGDGRLDSPVALRQETSGNQIAAGDINGDGFEDLAYENADGGLSWLVNTGAAGLDAGTCAWVPFGPGGSNAGSIVGLTYATFFPDGGVPGLLFEAVGPFECSTSTQDGQLSCGRVTGFWHIDEGSIAVADVTGDGFPDLLVGGTQEDGGPGVVVQVGAASAVPPIPNGAEPLPGVEPIASIALGNFNGDGYADLFVFRQGGPWEVWINSCGVEAGKN